jgi:hypothetical protein
MQDGFDDGDRIQPVKMLFPGCFSAVTAVSLEMDNTATQKGLIGRQDDKPKGGLVDKRVIRNIGRPGTNGASHFFNNPDNVSVVLVIQRVTLVAVWRRYIRFGIR